MVQHRAPIVISFRRAGRSPLTGNTEEVHRDNFDESCQRSPRGYPVEPVAARRVRLLSPEKPMA